MISYVVASRTTEIGVRLAIGAQPRGVLAQVIGDALKTVAPGVALGLVGALAAERVIIALLFGAAARDLTTYAAVAGCLLLTAVIAAYVPARRASRIDPVKARAAGSRCCLESLKAFGRDGRDFPEELLVDGFEVEARLPLHVSFQFRRKAFKQIRPDINRKEMVGHIGFAQDHTAKPRWFSVSQF
jgi:hypothetical protein